MMNNIETTICSVLDNFPDIRFCTLFGSAAVGRLTVASDIDIAVSAGRRLTIEEKFALTAELSRLLKREVDLVDLEAVSGLILEQALCKSKILLKKDPDNYAELLKRLWFHNADMQPYVRRILEQRAEKWLQ
jgi:predicted nucleotidyltransferase